MDTFSTAKKLLESAKIGGQKLVVIYDKEHFGIGKAFFEAGKEITKTKFFNLDDFGKRPLKELPKEIKEFVEKTDLLIILISKQSNNETNELTTIRRPLTKLMLESEKLRIGQLLDVSEEQFNEIFSYSPQEVKELNSKLFELLKNSKKIRITTPAGTDFSCELDKETKLINQDADLSKKSLSHSLLAGEVYGVPKNCNGEIVVDGVLGGQFIKYGLLESKPLILEIKNDKIISVKSENKELEKEFFEHIKRIENADRIGELGFGTNLALKKFCGVLGIDEKFPGNHIAFGHPYSEKTGAKWECKAHIDAVMKECSTWINDKQVLDKGKYLI
jgi:aminopeptidase